MHMTQALRQGAEAAGTALTRTWDELAHNEDLHKGLEFGFRAAGEVSKDVGNMVFSDAALNTWDTAFARGAERVGLEGAAETLSNPAITMPLNKAISGYRLVGSVWGGQAEENAKDLGKRIGDIHESIYKRRP